MAAGFDPDRFWDISLCEYHIHMRGAALRHARERDLVWWGAMMPRMKRPPKHRDFVFPDGAAPTRSTSDAFARLAAMHAAMRKD